MWNPLSSTRNVTTVLCIAFMNASKCPKQFSNSVELNQSPTSLPIDSELSKITSSRGRGLSAGESLWKDYGQSLACNCSLHACVPTHPKVLSVLIHSLLLAAHAPVLLCHMLLTSLLLLGLWCPSTLPAPCMSSTQSPWLLPSAGCRLPADLIAIFSYYEWERPIVFSLNGSMLEIILLQWIGGA